MKTEANATFSVATYNVLAQAYVRPGRYPDSPKRALEAAPRLALILDRIASVKADILCLQEVEPNVHKAIEKRLGGAHVGFYAQKRGRPDGCSVFVRRAAFRVESHETIHYRAHDRGDDQLALLVHTSAGARHLTVASTHLRWQKPGTPVYRHIGRQQLVELLERRETLDRDGTWIVAGDLNARSDSQVLQAASEHGFQLSCRSQRPWDTACINGKRRKLDYLLFPEGHLDPRPGKLPRLSRDQPMPSLKEPSDHLALRVEYTWCGR